MAEVSAECSEPSCPAPELVLGADDHVVLVALRCTPTRSDPGRAERFYVVLHRDHGPWTHVYCAVQSSRRDRVQVHLLRLWQGDCRSQACAWVGGHLKDCGAGMAAAPWAPSWAPSWIEGDARAS